MDCGFFLQGNIIHQWALTDNNHYQHGWISQAKCGVEVAKFKGGHTLWLHLYEVQKIGNVVFAFRSQESSYLQEGSTSVFWDSGFFFFFWSGSFLYTCVHLKKFWSEHLWLASVYILYCDNVQKEKKNHRAYLWGKLSFRSEVQKDKLEKKS